MNCALILSSRERKSLYRAIDRTIGHITGDDTRKDQLLNELDDGGIWNPCKLAIPVNESEEILILYSINYGISNIDEISHHLTNIKDRLLYSIDRRDGEKKKFNWPFVKYGSEGYYGPNWHTIRETAISRDRNQCSECHITRQDHKDQYSEDLHVHHIKPLSKCSTYTEANKLNNLKTLCQSCHSSIHNSKNKIIQ